MSLWKLEGHFFIYSHSAAPSPPSHLWECFWRNSGGWPAKSFQILIDGSGRSSQKNSIAGQWIFLISPNSWEWQCFRIHLLGKRRSLLTPGFLLRINLLCVLHNNCQFTVSESKRAFIKKYLAEQWKARQYHYALTSHVVFVILATSKFVTV